MSVRRQDLILPAAKALSSKHAIGIGRRIHDQFVILNYHDRCVGPRGARCHGLDSGDVEATCDLIEAAARRGGAPRPAGAGRRR